MVAAAALALGVTVLIGAVSYFVISNLMTQRIEMQMEAAARVHAARIASTLDAIDRDLTRLAASTMVTNALSDSVGREQYLAPFLSDYRAPSGASVWIRLLDFQGEPLVSSPGGGGNGYRDAPWIGSVLRTAQPYVSLVPGADRPRLLIVHPVIYPGSGTVEGLMAAEVALDGAFMMDSMPLSSSADSYRHRLVAGIDAVLAETGPALSRADRIESVASLNLPLRYAPLRLRVETSARKDIATLPLDLLSKAYLAAWPFVLLCVIWGSIRISRRVTAPLLALGKAAERITLENLDGFVVPAEGHDEPGRLGSALALMVRRLRVAHTELEQQLAELRLAAQVFSNSSEGIFLLDEDFRIVRANDTFTSITGYSTVECLGRSVHEILHVVNDGQGYPQAPQDLGQDGRWEGEIFALRKDNTHYIGRLRLGRVSRPKPGTCTYIGMIADVTERKEQQKHIHYLATHDPLTDLPNRALLRDRLSQAMAHAALSGSMVGVAFLDLDRFKVANDTHGHSFGDRVLQEIAVRLRRILRSGDTVARFGGDEFVILLPDLRTRQDAEAVSRKILGAFLSPLSIGGKEVHLACSVGLSCYPIHGEDADTLIGRADLAMYQAKEAGGNACVFYAPEMSAAVHEWARLEDAMHRALSRNEFILHYQPAIDLRSGSISSLEALVRWNHPDLGLLPPARFIPVAEHTSLIVPLGEWVLRAACAQAAEWLRQGLPPVDIAVNVSARQFQHPGFVETVRRILNLSGLDPQHLKLELTESLVMHGAEDFISVLTALKAMGIKLAIDDFGTGYSSLNYLHRFPVDELKIDRSFLRDIGRDGGNARIVRAVISLAHSLGLTVTAEGVETEEQVRFLIAHRCDQVQGYYFTIPHPPEAIAALLQADHRWPLPRTARRTLLREVQKAPLEPTTE